MSPHIPPYHPASFASQAPKRSRTLEKLPPAQIAVMKPPLLPFHPTPPLLPPPPAYAFASPLSVIESPRHPPRHSISAPHLPLQKPGTPPHGVYHPTAPFKSPLYHRHATEPPSEISSHMRPLSVLPPLRHSFSSPYAVPITYSIPKQKPAVFKIPGRSVIIRCLPDVNNALIRQHFEDVGHVKNVYHDARQQLAVVTFSQNTEATGCRRKYHKSLWNNRRIEVEIVKQVATSSESLEHSKSNSQPN